MSVVSHEGTVVFGILGVELGESRLYWRVKSSWLVSGLVSCDLLMCRLHKEGRNWF
jgi:hypothetical protein